MGLNTTQDKVKLKNKPDINNNKHQYSLKTKNKTIKKKHKARTNPTEQRYISFDANVVSRHIPASIMAMSTFYPQYQHCSYPVFNEWSPIIPVNLLYPVQPIPIIVNPVTMVSPQIYPYVQPIVIPPTISPPVILSSDKTSVCSYNESVGTELDSPPLVNILNGCESTEAIENVYEQDSIEYYLSLPKDLFPSARMITLDPNQLIDELCRLSNVYSHASWILDLEFGIPKSPITRPIPCYNVKFNSIHCKNTPDAIHPGFESCSQDFKKVFLFYYDCIVSTWYRGYVFLNCDISVENFQSWLQLPMQMLGMCWP